MRFFWDGSEKRMYRGSKRPWLRSQTRLRIYVRDGGRCRYCGRFVWPRESQVDHVRAWSRGGRHWRNLVLACIPCNQTKSDHNGWTPRPLPPWRTALDWLLILLLNDWPRWPDDF